MERSEGWAVPSNCTCHFSDQFYPDVSLWIPWPKYQPTDGSNHSEAQKPCCSRPRRSLVWCQEPGQGLSPIQDGPCQAQIQQQKFQQVQEKGFQKLVIVQKLIVIYILSMHFYLFSIYASLGFFVFCTISLQTSTILFMPWPVYWHFPCQPENLISYVQNCFVCVIQFWSARVSPFIGSLKSNFKLRTQPLWILQLFNFVIQRRTRCIYIIIIYKIIFVINYSFSNFNTLLMTVWSEINA